MWVLIRKLFYKKKTKFLNMWTWKKSGEFSYPSLFHFYTNFKSEDIDFRVKKNLHDNIKLVGKDDDNLKKDLIEKKMSLGLFHVKNNSFEPIDKNDNTFFKIPVKLPHNALAGKYEISMEVFKKNKLVSKKSRFFFS
ncbi:TIGR02186 family protein [Rickettsiales bacterium]|nr:TIGR02186 family protein [Rickettsiales bacterium]